MLKTLIKKQMTESFKGFFFDAKHGKAQSKGKTVFLFALFFVLMLVVVGGSFFALAMGLSLSMHEAGFDGVFFALMGLISILFGVCGSVFNTFSSLYLAKDNDLMFSMPIPPSYIVASRLLNVYLLGLMYSAFVFVPTMLAYQIFCGFNALALLGSLVMMFSISAVNMLLSCVLGWVVAKVSLKLKNKSFITVLISVVFIGAYYVFYFKAQGLIPELIANAGEYGSSISSAAPFLAGWGDCGAGEWVSVLVCLLGSVAVLGGLWAFMSHSFMKIATSTGAVENTVYHEKTAKQRSVSAALLSKEFTRFTTSANYMLNSGFGVLMIPTLGVVALITADKLTSSVPPIVAVMLPVLVAAAMCMASSMNTVAAPSVSLEGKTLWVLQTLPADPWLVLWAKAETQILLTGVPMLFCGVCIAIAFPFSFVDKLLVILFSLVYVLFSSLFDLLLGLKMPNLTWTSELVPIKQSGCVAVAIFGAWGYALAVAGIGFLLAPLVGAAVTLVLLTALTGLFAWLTYRWLKTKGTRIFAEL